jgi:uncharacterized cupin superfamily protein
MDRLYTLTHAADCGPAEAKVRARATEAWAIWDSTTHEDGSGKFNFDYSDNHQERVLILSGKAELTPSDGSAVVKIAAGDHVVFHRGFKCAWNVLSPMKKHYCYFDEHGEETQPNNVACDACGCDCFVESYFVEASGEDICPACFAKDSGGAYSGAEHQREGKPIPADEPKPKRRKVDAAASDE